MINVSDDLKELLKHDYLPYRSEPVHKELTMTFADPPITIDNSKRKSDTFSLDECLCDGEDLKFGDCQASIIKFTCADVTDDIVGKEFTCTEMIDSESIPLGIFKVFNAEKTNDLRYKDVIAYDRLKNLDTNVASWYKGLKFPLTQKAFRDSLCSYIGIAQETVTLVNDNMTIEKTIDADVLNGLTVLKAICEINGCFGKMTRTGTLKYKVLSKSTVDDIIPQETSRELLHEEYTTKAIDKLQICQEDGDIGAIVGTGTNCYTIKGNFLVYGKTASELATIAENASTNILGISYKPFTDDLYGLPYLEVGDRITFDGKFTSYVLRRTLTGVQALKDRFETKGSRELLENTSLNMQIEQLKGKSNVLKRTVEEMTSTITSLETNVNNAVEDANNAVTEANKVVTTVKEMQTEVKQTSEGLSAEITAREELQIGIIGTNYCDELPIDDDDICDDDGETIINQIIKDSTARVELLEDKFDVELQDNISQLQAQLTLSTQEFSTQIFNLQKDTSTQFQMLDNSIALCVKEGELSAQLSLEDGTVSIIGNRFNWTSTYSSMTNEGILTCDKLVATNATFTSSGNKGTVNVTSGGLSYVQNAFHVDIEYGQLKVTDGYTTTQIFANEVYTPRITAESVITVGGYSVLTTAHLSSFNTEITSLKNRCLSLESRVSLLEH